MTEPIAEAPGLELLADGPRILDTIAGLSPRQAATHPSFWPLLGVPAIDRGALVIFPLAVATISATDRSALERLREVCAALQQECIHFYGGDHFHGETTLDPEEDPYGRRLAEVGAHDTTPRGVVVWRVRDRGAALVLVVDEPRGQATLAFHLVPKDWIWNGPSTPATKREASRRRSAVKEQAAVDVVWSWPAPDLAQAP
ncbi:hypothetical protein ITJ57_02915 [Plantibacter sp. VKM Ac-2880]|uniref:hypothetical protein n=1 Tax=Plantibacter sp. VKM Ac-2880 TaxID=2783827 RepID=UPI00188FEFB0|nr:hypothetical protein [Plantibacter sp. VKM Ac-2880]MBF4567708.1 hypothetical protein [Plantibacter sp. VKM Ac-2880]